MKVRHDYLEETSSQWFHRVLICHYVLSQSHCIVSKDSSVSDKSKTSSFI